MPPRHFKLREKFLLSFLLVVLTSLFVSVTFSYTIYLFNLNENLNPELKKTSEVFTSRINEIKERNLILADIITRDATVVGFLNGTKSREELIDSLRRVNSKIGMDFIQVIDTKGIVNLKLEDLRSQGQNKLGNQAVAKSLKGVKVSTFQIEDGNFVIAASVPVESEGIIHGALLTGFDVTDSLLNKVVGSLDDEISIFTASGKLVATTVSDENGVASRDQKLSEERLKRVASSDGENIEQRKVSSSSYKVIYTPIRDFEGKISAISMTAIPLDPIANANTTTILVLVFSNLITVFLAYLIATSTAKRLAEPILTMKKGTEVIAAGNLDYRINIKTNDETEELASSFNKMTSRLKELIGEVSDEKNKIAAERNKFSVVLGGVLDGIITLNYERKITYFNKAAQEITGLYESDAMGKSCDEVLLIFRNKVRISASDFCPLTSFGKDQVVFADKNLKLATARKELYISMTSTVIKDGKLADLGCIITFRDSTRERELEEMKLDFVSMAAHELRTPLTAIRGYLTILFQELKERLSEEQIKYIERISISASQLSALVENLLDVSKIEHNTLELDITKVDWVSLVKSVASEFEELSRQRNVRLSFEEPKFPLSPVAVDKFRISEVLSNLVANALNYTDSGGSVKILAAEAEGFVQTSVVDTGRGIPEKSIPHLFTKFYRVSGALEQGSKGTGLGLFISKSIVNKHKGEIWVESKLGVGTTFSFTVPIYKEPEKKGDEDLKYGKLI